MSYIRTSLSFLIIIFLILPVSINGIQITYLSEQIEDLPVFGPPPEPIRNIAEFEQMEGVLIRYPFGISYSVIAELSEDVIVWTIVSSSSQQSTVLSLYQSHGVNTENCEFLIHATDTYWTRDYGPWFVFNGDDELGVIDFNYNRPRPNDNAIPGAFASDQGLAYYYMSLKHSGGNYMTDGQGISISTDLVLSENPGYTPPQINQFIEEYLGVTTYYTVPDVNDEYIKHIDCWAKYLAPDKIIIREVPPSHPQYYEIESAVANFTSEISCYGTPYEIYRVYTPNDQPYTNSLIINDKVLVPTTGSQWDDDALASYDVAMPGYEVLGFAGSWQSTDALHCRTKGIPDRGMLYVDHTPLYGTLNGDEGIIIEATIIPYSGYGLVTSSCVVYWKENNNSWQTTQFNYQGDDLYQATLFPQVNGSTLYYYIQAEDQSGRIAYHPYIGESDAHSFKVNVSYSNSPPDKPLRPTGRKQGEVETSYAYTSNTVDIDDDEIYYMWDWGDDTFSDWLGPYSSGENCTEMYAWSEEGTYEIRVKARDSNLEESEWSEPLVVKMPYTHSITFELLSKFFQRHPILNVLFTIFLG